MNACGVDKACKSNAPTTKLFVITQTGWWSGSGERASNALVTYPRDRNKPPKGGLMSDSLERVKFKWYRRGLGPISLLVG